MEAEEIMLLLSKDERALWRRLGQEAMEKNAGPDGAESGVRANLLPMFRFYVGTLMTAQGRQTMGKEWLKAGTLGEEDGLFSNAFLTGFLGRHNGKLVAPDVCFKDPRPFVHFAGVPMMRQSRRNFVKTFVDAMPVFRRPFRMMDIGCGDGGLTAWLLREMRGAGKIGDIGEVLLVDASKGMIDLA
ncbi:MAG TPA: class I SAM-dependent methyltransferase, partial [Candidatus Brocadiia bacterium]|nr:class I SAM-dependent methyltransferase [Candidatus Brocadiia bacterium]